MAKLKMLKYPKAPKTTASLDVKKRYLEKIKEIDRENAKRKADNKKSDELSRQIANIRRK